MNGIGALGNGRPVETGRRADMLHVINTKGGQGIGGAVPAI